MRLWIALGIAGLLAVGAAVAGIGLACNALIGGASEQLGRGLEFAQDELEREQRQSSITHEQFASVRPGTARAELEKRLGRPVDIGGGDPGGGGGVPPGAACIYYNERGQPLLAGPTYRFCFRGGRLVAKDVL